MYSSRMLLYNWGGEEELKLEEEEASKAEEEEEEEREAETWEVRRDAEEVTKL